MASIIGLAGGDTVGNNPAVPTQLFLASEDNNGQGVGTYAVSNEHATETVYVNCPSLHGTPATGGYGARSGWRKVAPGKTLYLRSGLNLISKIVAYASAAAVPVSGGQDVHL